MLEPNQVGQITELPEIQVTPVESHFWRFQQLGRALRSKQWKRLYGLRIGGERTGLAAKWLKQGGLISDRKLRHLAKLYNYQQRAMKGKGAHKYVVNEQGAIY